MRTDVTLYNEALYDAFWQSCPDFSKYNPGAVHRRRIILKLLASIRFTSLLDAGCGDGQLLAWLRARLPRDVALAGADLSKATVEQNTQRHPFATFHVLNLEKAALSEQFDAIVCTEVIEHLVDQSSAIANIARMLKTNGHLLLTCPAGRIHATELHFGHVSHPTPVELRRVFAATGFAVVELRNWGFPCYIATKALTNINPIWAIRNFARTQYGPTAKLLSNILYYLNFLNLSSHRLGCQLFVLARKLSV